MGLFSKLKQGLSKTRDSIVSGIDSVFYGASSIDDDFYDEIEEILVMGDIGINTTEKIMEDLKERVRKEHIKEPLESRRLLMESIEKRMETEGDLYEFEKKPSVILVIGVNGVGKTTTIGKLSAQLRSLGKNVIIAAADTFRAAAKEQLEVWAKRSDAQFVYGQDGQDPASVVFDGNIKLGLYGHGYPAFGRAVHLGKYYPRRIHGFRKSLCLA